MIMKSYHGTHKLQHPISLDALTNRQRSHVKDHLVDTNNRFNGIFSSFSPLHSELLPSLRIIDNFSDQFSFNLCDKEKNNKIRLQQLDNMVIESSNSPSTAIIITDASIKNDIATFISHMHTFNSPLIKTLHHAVFVTSTEAELFAIRCGINQASNQEDISKIIVITDSIHIAKKIFDLLLYLYQIHVVAILNKLCKLFIRNQNNLIEFQECPSQLNWSLHKVVDKDSKAFNPLLVFPCKMLWDFSRKTECDNIINNWKMTFQASDLKGR